MGFTGTKRRLWTRFTLLATALMAAGLGITLVLLLRSGSGREGAIKKLLSEADGLLWSGRAAEAETLLKRGMAEYGETVDGLLRLGTAQSLEKKFAEGEVSFKRGLELEPDEPRLLHNLGLMYLRQKRYDEALAYFKKTLEVRPWHPQSNFYISVIHKRQGNTDEAMKYVINELNVNAPNPSAWRQFLELRDSAQKPGKRGFPWDMLTIWAGIVAASALLYWLKRSFWEPGESPGFSTDPDG